MPGLHSDPVTVGRPVRRDDADGLFRHVMVCLDRSPRAVHILEQASALATLAGADLTAIRVVPGGAPGSRCADPVDWELSRREEVADLMRTAEVAGAAPGVEPVVACGAAARCVEEAALRRNVDLLAIGSGAFATPHHWGLGGTARHLAETFHGSVLVVPDEAAGEPPRERRVIVPMDGSAPAEAALRYAVAIARARGAELVILHAVPEGGLLRPGRTGEDDSPLWRDLREEAERLADARLARLRRLLPVDAKDHRMRRLDDDEPRRALNRAICEERGDLVVLAARGLGKDPELPIGSTAEYLLSRAATPVLLVRKGGATAHRASVQAPRRPAAAWQAR